MLTCNRAQHERAHNGVDGGVAQRERIINVALTAIELELRWSNASGRSLKHNWVGVYAYDMELLGGRYVLQVGRSANTDVAH